MNEEEVNMDNANAIQQAEAEKVRETITHCRDRAGCSSAAWLSASSVMMPFSAFSLHSSILH